MRRIILGQILLTLCCIVYLVWWYRGFRPGVHASRISGMNGFLLMITAVLGISGITFSLLPVPQVTAPKLGTFVILAGGIAAYILLGLITKIAFQRIVTTELILIVGWAVLELTLINRLNGAGALPDGRFLFMCAVIAAAFIISLVLYVAYYRMEEMKAFYAAMIPLMTEAVSMAVLVGLLSVGKQ